MGRQALHPPSPAASSATTAGTLEEEGLHACPLPRNLEVAFNVVSVYFGGGRIGTVTFLTVTSEFFERGKQALHLTFPVLYLGGGGTDPPPHNVGELTDDAECHFVSRRGLKHVSRRGETRTTFRSVQVPDLDCTWECQALCSSSK